MEFGIAMNVPILEWVTVALFLIDVGLLGAETRRELAH
jgi:hypothetical protein